MPLRPASVCIQIPPAERPIYHKLLLNRAASVYADRNELKSLRGARGMSRPTGRRPRFQLSFHVLAQELEGPAIVAMRDAPQHHAERMRVLRRPARVECKTNAFKDLFPEFWRLS